MSQKSSVPQAASFVSWALKRDSCLLPTEAASAICFCIYKIETEILGEDRRYGRSKMPPIDEALNSAIYYIRKLFRS
jgi:hypothetical protein